MQEFICKSCDKTVVYEPEPTTVPMGQREDSFRVYLSCENGHLHPYDVKA